MHRAAAAFLALTLAASPAYADDAPKRTFAITGEGSVTYTPDMATLQSAVVTEGQTAREALDANTGAMNKVFEALKTAGIEQRDIATSGFSVQPRYTQPARDGTQSDAPRISGYEVQNNVSVRVRDLDALGGVIDALVSAGSNRMGGVSFDTTGREAKTDDARRNAVADARRKAELYTEAAGVKLGRIITISEQSFGRPEPMMMRAMAADSAVPVAAGERELSVSVSIVWELED